MLIHGSANSAGVWQLWQARLAGLGRTSHALDLRGHGDSAPIDLSSISMHDYAADVQTLASQLAEPPVLVGWSMGGLVAMMAAALGTGVACIGLEPSTPARQVDRSVEPKSGEFDSEEYGLKGDDRLTRRIMHDLNEPEREIALASLCNESRYARDERQAGIVIESLPCPLLIVVGRVGSGGGTGEKYESLWLDADSMTFGEASHWGLVLSDRTLDALVPRAVRWADAALERTTGRA